MRACGSRPCSASPRSGWRGCRSSRTAPAEGRSARSRRRPSPFRCGSIRRSRGGTCTPVPSSSRCPPAIPRRPALPCGRTARTCCRRQPCPPRPSCPLPLSARHCTVPFRPRPKPSSLHASSFAFSFAIPQLRESHLYRTWLFALRPVLRLNPFLRGENPLGRLLVPYMAQLDE